MENDEIAKQESINEELTELYKRISRLKKQYKAALRDKERAREKEKIAREGFEKIYHVYTDTSPVGLCCSVKPSVYTTMRSD